MDRERVLELFDRYGDMVYRVALGYLRSSQEAEDAVQTVFLKLAEGAGTPWPSSPGSPSTIVKTSSAPPNGMRIPLWRSWTYRRPLRTRRCSGRSWTFRRNTGWR